MDLTFQVPMQYCSLQHWTLLLSPVTSTSAYCFCFGSNPSFFLELILHWPPVAYWAPTDLGSSSFGIPSFCLFIPFMGFSRQEYWSGLPFPSPVDHNLSDLSTMTHPSWIAPRAWLSFIELDKDVVLVWLDWLDFCEFGFSVSAFWCPLATSIILLVLPWAWGISSQLLQQSTAAAPYLGQGVSPYRRPSWPSLWDSSSRASCTHAATAPRVGPPGCCPWPQTWGNSSWPCLVCRVAAARGNWIIHV